MFTSINVFLNQGHCAKSNTCCNADLHPQDGESEAFSSVLLNPFAIGTFKEKVHANEMSYTSLCRVK